jgi:pimeloyl-ACP methyl ester carboxylesterase
MTTNHVFLIPGFFGFVNFGRLVYFGHVRDFLEDAFARERLPVEIHRVRLGPTSSLRTRAAELLRFVHETAPERAPIHLIGHSTGGLDARLFATPKLALESELDLDLEAYAARVKTIVSVATPHRGTPLAGFFSSMMGQRVLRLLSVGTITVLRRGRVPAGLLARGVGALARIAINRTSPPVAMLDHLEGQLLGNVAPEQRDLLDSFLRDVRGDQALMPQLTPEAMDLFAAATADRPGVRYGSVTARAAEPQLRGRFRLGFDPWHHVTYSLYAWLHGRVGAGDGIVPIESQLHGELVHEALGDHLDVIGHFDGPDLTPPHVDWLASGSRFDRAQFSALWTAVARFVARR